MSTFVQDFRYALRTLRRDRWIMLVAVLSLGLAIGGNSAVFSLIDAFLFRPLPYDEPDRIVLLGERTDDAPANSGAIFTSLPTYADVAERSRTLEAWAAIRPRRFTVRGSDRAEPVSGNEVTPGFFRLLGMAVTSGRAFLEEEGVEGARRVAVMTEEYRQRSFGDADPLGEVLHIDGEPHEVVGVLPPDFAFIGASSALWVPLRQSPVSAERDDRNIIAVARMASGATMEGVRAEMTAIADQLEAEYPETQAERTLDSYNLRHDIPTSQTRILFGFLQGTVFVVLLIACVNITNLLLVRGQKRSKEIALRAVLGASRLRIVRQLLTESTAVVAVGALLGLGIAKLGIEALARNFAGSVPASYAPTLDHRILLFTLAVSAAAGLVFGLVPAAQTFRRSHVDALKEGGGRSSDGGGRKRFSRALVIGEIALSMMALGVGSMVVRSFLQIRASDPGYESSSLLTAVITVPPERYEDDERRRQLLDRILERTEAMQGARSAALASAFPQGFFAASDSVRIEGETADSPARTAYTVAATPGYLETLDIPLAQGRFFERRDRPGSVPVAAVDRTLARTLFGDASPLGRRIVLRDESREIVGVVDDIQQVLVSPPGQTIVGTVYTPVAQTPSGAGNIFVRASGKPRALADPLRDAVQGLDPDLALAGVQTMEERISQAFVGIRVFNVVLGGFGLVALFLAALGTYAVLAYTVSRRSHEIGIRMAVGAAPRSIVGMVSRQGLIMALVGLGLGGLATWPLVGVLRSVLRSFATVQPSTLAVIAAVLFGVTMLASIVPARRAAAVDPVTTLRQE